MIYKDRIRVGIIERNHLLRERLADIVRSQKDMVVAFSTSAPGNRSNPTDVIIAQWEIFHRPQNHQKLDAEDNPKLLLINVDLQQQGFVCHLRHGARGFILSDSAEEEIVSAIRSVMETGWAIPVPVAIKICSEVAQEAAKHSESGFLMDVRITSREREIIRLVNEGLTNKEIAQRLNISPETVKSHVHRLMEKLGARRRADLTR